MSSPSLYEILLSKDIGGWKEEFVKNSVQVKKCLDIIDKKEKEYGIYYPAKEDIFRCFELTHLEDVKVIVWSESCYATLLDDGTPRATGLAFSVKNDDTMSNIVKNIYTEIKTNFPMFERPDHGNLEFIAKRGVLLINSCMNFCPTSPKCFTNLWGGFAFVVISIINEKVENCIHLLWGGKCEKLEGLIKSRSVFITSAPDSFNVKRGFSGCKHFLKINITLLEQGKQEINWNEDSGLIETTIENLRKLKEK
jgi:uracil-DNA glycosylase